jgi:Arc/MetJ-type ribon-helix-helix transcriptional regulator
MTIHVSKDLESSLNAAVQSGLFPSVDEAITAAWIAFTQQQGLSSPPQPETTAVPIARPHSPIWEEVLELTAGIPDEDFSRLPADGAEQHDHYIYGTPKRPVTS